MNSYLQIAMGLSPVLLVFALMSIFGKRCKLRNIGVLCLFAAGVAAAAWFGFSGEQVSIEPAEQVSVVRLSSGEALSLVYATAAEGDIPTAMELLRSHGQTNAYTPEHTLCLARLYGAKGDFAAAQALYAKVNFSGIKKEIAAVEEAIADEYYAGEQASQTIAAAIAKAGGEEGAAQVAAAVSQATGLYARLLDGDYLEEDVIRRLRKDFDKIAEELPGYMSVETVRKAWLKTMILAAEYDRIAEAVNDFEGYEILMVASELYVNRILTEKDFTASDLGEELDKYEIVLEHLQESFDKLYSKKENELEYIRTEAFLAELENRVENPGYCYMKSELLDYANDDRFADSSKAYVQLAKIENYMGNDQSCSDYLDDALLSVGGCDDDSFVVPMNEIIQSVSSNRDDTEALKEIPRLVENVLDYTLPFNMDTDRYTNVPEKDREDDQEEQTPDFETQMTDTVLKKRTKINVSGMDVASFPEVKAYVNVSSSVAYSASQLQELLQLTDCGVPVTDFTVEKVEYSSANILICCDVSGSMGGQPIRDLRQAVEHFISTSSGIESISLVCFNDEVVTSLSFGTPNEELLLAAQNMSSGGGTNMYDAMLNCVSMFSSAENSADCIILMSDGADGYRRSSEEILANIGQVCRAKGIEVYSLGLGDSVDSEYMQYYTNATGGYYLYADSFATMSGFFDDLRSQFLNRYEITFTAEDTLTNSRVFYAALNDDSLAYDTEYYTLDGSSADAQQQGSAVALGDNIAFNGLDKRLVFRGQPQILLLKGTGFQEDLKISLELKDNLTYSDVALTYVDENTYSFVIPGNIACGTYDVRIRVDGKLAVLPDEVTVVTQGGQKEITYGPYSFTAYTVAEEGNKIKLSNGVCLNGWLYFSDSVTLEGNLDSGSITMYTPGTMYTTYNPSKTKGIASVLGMKGTGLKFMMTNKVRLYNDPSTSIYDDKYPTDGTMIPAVYISDLMYMESPSLHIYPQKLEIRMKEFNTKLPLQDKILSSGTTDPFSFDYDGSITIRENVIDAKIEFSLENERSDEKKSAANLLNLNANLGFEEFKVKIDTEAGKYEIDFAVGLDFIKAKKNTSIGLHLAWSDKLCPTEVVLNADFAINGTIAGVPVTYKDFKLGVEDIDPDSSIWDWMLVGGMDIAAGKISEFIPGIEEFTGDFSVAAIDDAKLSFSLGQGYVKAEAKAKLCTVTVGEFEIECGRLHYTNLLLDMDSVDATGLRASSKIGIMWDTNNCDIDISGSGELNLHTRFLGVDLGANYEIEVRWWLFKKSISKGGHVVLGMWIDDRGYKNFGIRAAGYDLDAGSKVFYVVYNEQTKGSCGKMKL